MGFKSARSNLFAGLPLEAEGGSFSPRLSSAAAVIAPVLKLQCLHLAEPQVCPTLAQQKCYSVLDKTTYCLVLVGYLSKDNTAGQPQFLKISVWTKPAAGKQLS